MTTPEQEQYVFMSLSLIDMERVSTTLEALPTFSDQHVRAALIRDAIISYAKPFSRNRGLLTHHLSLSESIIPAEFADEHKEIRSLRDQLVAHNDLTWQKVQFGPAHSFCVTGYNRIFVDHLLKPMGRLASIVHAHVRRLLIEAESNGL